MSLPNDGSADERIKRALQRLRRLPLANQYEAQLKFLAVGLDVMSLEQIAAFRAEIIARFCNQPRKEPGSSDELLELVDGHVALRQLRAEQPASE
jgi:hypothetical protein